MYSEKEIFSLIIFINGSDDSVISLYTAVRPLDPLKLLLLVTGRICQHTTFLYQLLEE